MIKIILISLMAITTIVCLISLTVYINKNLRAKTTYIDFKHRASRLKYIWNSIDILITRIVRAYITDPRHKQLSHSKMLELVYSTVIKHVDAPDIYFLDIYDPAYEYLIKLNILDEIRSQKKHENVNPFGFMMEYGDDDDEEELTSYDDCM